MLRCFASLRRFSSAGVPAPARNRFGSPLPEIVEKEGWDSAWKQGCTPWDAGRSPPMLAHLLSRRVLPPCGTVLVPGVGAGYDALTFAAAGYSVLGIDLSPTAIARCEALRETRRSEAAESSNTQQQPQQRAVFRTADFFALPSSPGFDIVFDYTFLQALPPAQWPAYAMTVARLLAPEGELCHIMFPCAREDEAGAASFAERPLPQSAAVAGPPFSMRPSALAALLAPHALVCLESAPVPAHLSFGPRSGREALSRWAHAGSRRAAAHAASP